VIGTAIAHFTTAIGDSNASVTADSASEVIDNTHSVWHLGDVEPLHALRPETHRALIAYSRESWNSYEAVFLLQQLGALVPVFAQNLEALYGRSGVGDARRAWGLAADVLSAMLDVPPTIESLIEFGFVRASDVGHIILTPNEFSLAGSPILRRLNVTRAVDGDLAPLLRLAVAHDSVAAPLRAKFADELMTYDAEAEYLIHELMNENDDEPEVQSFREMVRSMDSVPKDFPVWDGRPLFIDEQRVVLDYLAKAIGAEIVSHNLVDDQLGRVLLERAGALMVSDVTDAEVLNPNVVPAKVFRRPVELVCHQAGHAVLTALQAFDPEADVLDRLYIVEMAVWNELGIDITDALASTRQLIMDRYLRDLDQFTEDVLQNRVQPIRPYEFPELG
jgi:hypothetical protein